LRDLQEELFGGLFEVGPVEDGYAVGALSRF
jgi:hypothetical protein